MAKSKGRHRLSLIIATLGPSTDDNQELLIMITAGIARQWVEGPNVAIIKLNLCRPFDFAMLFPYKD
jgi:hypothetical protein